MKTLVFTALLVLASASPAFAQDYGYGYGWYRDSDQRAANNGDVSSEYSVDQLANSAFNEAQILNDFAYSVDPYVAKKFFAPIRMKASSLSSSSRGRGEVAGAVQDRALALVQAIDAAKARLSIITSSQSDTLSEAAKGIITVRESLCHKFEFNCTDWD